MLKHPRFEEWFVELTISLLHAWHTEQLEHFSAQDSVLILDESI